MDLKIGIAIIIFSYLLVTLVFKWEDRYIPKRAKKKRKKF